MRNARIILGGGGDMEASQLLDEKFFSLLEDGSKILYIPVAMGGSAFKLESCIDWFSSLLSRHSKGKELDFSTLSESDSIPDLQNYDAIYIGGGNTYNLLDYMYRMGAAKKLLVYIDGGGLVYGGSAGAIILGKDIRTVEQERSFPHQRDGGFDLLKGRSVYCHYSERNDRRLLAVSLQVGPTIAIPENGGLIMDAQGDILDIVGDVFVFDGGKKQKLDI